MLVAAVAVVLIVGGLVLFSLTESESDLEESTAPTTAEPTNVPVSTEQDDAEPELSDEEKHSALLDDMLADIADVRPTSRDSVQQAYFYGDEMIEINVGALRTLAYFDGESWVHIDTGGEDPFCTEVAEVPDEFKPDCFDENTDTVEGQGFVFEERTYTLDLRE